MAQGKAYTKEQRQVILESLKPYLQLGYSRVKACQFIGFDNSLLGKWAKDDEALSMKLMGWENEVSVLARKNLRNKIEKLEDSALSLEWLRAKDRQEFGKNVDITSEGKRIGKIQVELTKFGEEDGGNNT